MDSDSGPPPAAPRPTVFLPCHTLDDFPGWLDEPEADDLLAAWTAAWHPSLVAAAGAAPAWASADLPPPDDGPRLGIVPTFCDDRFAAQWDASGTPGSVWVRHTAGRDDMVAAAAAAVGADPRAGAAWADELHALGLAVLLAELLARRMRSTADLDSEGFNAAVVNAARAAVAGRDDDARAAIAECYGWIESCRARFYPVDLWLLDLVLLAPSTLGRPLRLELESPVPLGIVAAADLLPSLAAEHPDSLAALRDRLTAGGASICGGRLDDRPLDGLLPEGIRDSLQAGLSAWRDRTGTAPTTFGRHAGGSSALLPQLLAGLGFEAAVWGTFDGSPLPDPGTSRIRWDGTGGGCIDAVARLPLDARHARTVLELPERLGDAMDHEHVAVVTFAHHAGTAGPWHALVRRIGSRTTAFGTFVTPDELFRKTAGAGTLVAFEPDAFPPTPSPAARGGAAIDAGRDAAAATAREVHARLADLRPLVAAPAVAPPSRTVAPAPASPSLLGRWFGAGRSDDPARVLDNGLLRVRVHDETGGLLSLRRPADRGNRLSQRLALRAGAVDDDAATTLMRADSIIRGTTPSGRDGIVSTGRLLGADGGTAATFTQGVALVDGLALAVLDVAITPVAPLAGRTSDHHLACRFAWHENEAVEIRRSLHGQSIVTERTRFTAPHFVEIRGGGGLRAAEPDHRDGVVVLTGGLPWHVLSSPHVLDSILAAEGVAAGQTVVRRLAVGLGLERPWDLALALLADAPLAAGVAAVPANVRLTVDEVVREGGRPVRARIGLVESAGLAGEARIEWAVPVAAATAVDLRGRSRDDVTVAVTGGAVVVSVRRYEWLQLTVDFQA